MSVLLTRLPSRMPSIVRRQAVVRLFRATAAAFGRDMPDLSGLSREQCLLEYARFTAQQAEQALCCGENLPGLQERLYQNAYRLSWIPGRLLGVRSAGDVVALGRLLYDLLDIVFQGESTGEIVISRCYFSSFYSPEVCQVMSAMDSGLLAGLAGAGDLVFTQRITERHACCRAHFVLAVNQEV